MTPGEQFFEAIEAGSDPAAVAEAADRAATIIVRGARGADHEAVGERLLHLAETEGIETIAELWSGAPADSLAGCLWRLYLLRQWVYADPVGVSHQFEAGRAHAEVASTVAGVADPPGPDELRTMVDDVLRGIAVSDFADVLFRAAAFARVDRHRARRPRGPDRRRPRGCRPSPTSSRTPPARSSTTSWGERRCRAREPGGVAPRPPKVSVVEEPSEGQRRAHPTRTPVRKIPQAPATL